jgi:hypothetical protein
MTDADARRGMTEIMNSDVVEFSGSAQPFPRLRQVYERFLPGNRPLMMNPPVAASGRAERSRSTAKVGSLRKIGLEPGTGVAVRWDDTLPVPVNPAPPSLQHLIAPRAGQQQQSNRRCRIKAVGVVGFEFTKRHTEPAQFVLT